MLMVIDQRLPLELRRVENGQNEQTPQDTELHRASGSIVTFLVSFH
jgi:hypothetical protein